MISTLKTPHSTIACKLTTGKCSCQIRPSMAETTSAFTYQKFVRFALQETQKYTHLTPSPLQNMLFPPRIELYYLPCQRSAFQSDSSTKKNKKNFECLSGMDRETELHMLSYDSPKIRLLRSLSIEGRDGMQVLDFAIFPRAEFDLPIFCANFFTTAVMNIVVLDLNPLHDVISQRDYKKKYYEHLMPLGREYAEVFPWGGKITGESMKFFSPIVIWTKFPPSYQNHHLLYSAFKAYFKSWLELMEQASAETDISQIMVNLEAQHRYLTWRAEKDPGHHLLRRLVGEALAKEIVTSFLFNGVDELGSKTFVDYFPEYKCDDGSINQKRSMIGKSFESRPWDARGEFIGNSLR